MRDLFYYLFLASLSCVVFFSGALWERMRARRLIDRIIKAHVYKEVGSDLSEEQRGAIVLLLTTFRQCYYGKFGYDKLDNLISGKE